MKIALYSSFSKEMSDLVKITHPNHAQYAARHGYDWITTESSYEYANRFGMEKLIETMDQYDAVLLHDADLLFMNQRIKLESIIQEGDSVIVSRETHGWCPLNNGVCLIVVNDKSRALFRRIIDDYNIWSQYEWLWQTHLWNLLQDDEVVQNTVRLVSPKAMNCSPFEGLSLWQLGDFIVHFMGLPLPSKIKYAAWYVKKAGEPTDFNQQRKSPPGHLK